MKHYNKILLLACHWLGDNFWSMQVLPVIKDAYPDAEIWIGTKGHSKDLFNGIIDSEKIIILDNIISDRHRESVSLKEYVYDLTKVRKEKFDIGVDLTCNRYSALFLFLSGIKERAGLRLHKLSFLYTMNGGEFDTNRHLVNRPFQTLRTLISNAGFNAEKIICPKSYCKAYEVSSLLEIDVLTNKIAVLAPSAGWEDKIWDEKNYIKVGNILSKLGYSVVVSGSPKEEVLCTRIAEQITGAVSFNKELKYFLTLIEYTDFAICNDNGAGHLLAAAGVKLISVFCGGTDPEKCGPLGKNVTVVNVENRESGIKEAIKVLHKQLF